MELNSTASPLNGLPDPQGAYQWNNWNNRWSLGFCSIIIIAITTRFLSGIYGASKPAQNGSKTVPLIPYWMPILGHIPQFSLIPEKFLNKTRDMYKGGVFALNLGGTTHNIIFSPHFGATLMNQKSSIADMDSVGKHIMTSVFGYPKSAFDKYDAALKEISACYKHLMSDPSLGNMVQKTIEVTQRNITNLVTFSESMVDQVEWERTSRAETITKPNGEQVVEASMLPLIRDFIAANANPSLMGSDFVNNNPEFFQDLWDLDRGFMYLATGLPRWVPIPKLLRAHIMRRRTLSAILKWEEAMEKHENGEDPGPEWQDLDDINPVLKDRMKVYRKHDFPMAGRAALELALIWAMNANANNLIFWMLNHIYADPTLLAMMREEIAPYVQASQPKQVFNIAEAPRLSTFDHEGLATKCPLLKACYIESLRLDAAPMSFRVMKSDFVLSNKATNSSGASAEKFLLKKGTYAHVVHSMHHTDPTYFPSPSTYNPHRHFRTSSSSASGEPETTVDMGTIRPYGGGHSMCKGRAFAHKEALIFTAAIISLWDMETAGGGGVWKMPRYKRATGVYTTNDDVRVWISRRKGLPVL